MEQQIELNDVYALAPHHRFQWEEAQQSYVILFPEGMVKLNGSAGEVLKRVDGKATVGDIIAELKAAFPGVEGIEQDILSMIELAAGKFWIRKV
ncbi:MAG TPA: pyrroloquinoline quinone biosynthesis peptide chaperone PqqD [Methylophilaceae bacterium]|jgi:pyrroloquinoline quinone biosynthesis protein D